MNTQATSHQLPATGLLRGLNHLTLAVSQLETSLAFYTELLGCRHVARWPKGAYLLAGSLWLALIVDQQTRKGPLPEYTHFALDVAPEHFTELSQRLLAAGVTIWKENRSEGDSLYFLDPDGHKLELHATDLYSRLNAALVSPWQDIEILIDPEELK